MSTYSALGANADTSLLPAAVADDSWGHNVFGTIANSRLLVVVVSGRGPNLRDAWQHAFGCLGSVGGGTVSAAWLGLGWQAWTNSWGITIKSVLLAVMFCGRTGRRMRRRREEVGLTSKLTTTQTLSRKTMGGQPRKSRKTNVLKS